MIKRKGSIDEKTENNRQTSKKKKNVDMINTRRQERKKIEKNTTI